MYLLCSMLQVLLPHMLEVDPRHVKVLGTIGSRNIFNPNAWRIPPQEGRALIALTILTLLNRHVDSFWLHILNSRTSKNMFLLFLQVWVLCNDCGRTSNVNYHVIGHKCSGCGSYNTRSTCGPSESRSRSIEPSISSSVGSLPDQMGRAIAPEMLAE
jgi:hypothetical protein